MNVQRSQRCSPPPEEGPLDVLSHPGWLTSVRLIYINKQIMGLIILMLNESWMVTKQIGGAYRCRWHREKPTGKNAGSSPMIRNAFIVLAITAMLGSLGANSVSAQSHHEGRVKPCSLAGVNTAHHPDIFGNPRVARDYGFVQSSDGTWRVESGCRRHGGHRTANLSVPSPLERI
jgi:hypothetical protein